MNFTLTEEQQSIQQTFRRFAEEKVKRVTAEIEH